MKNPRQNKDRDFYHWTDIELYDYLEWLEDEMIRYDRLLMNSVNEQSVTLYSKLLRDTENEYAVVNEEINYRNNCNRF